MHICLSITGESKTPKKISKKMEPVSKVELYKAFRSIHTKHTPNLKNIKRKFFKHDPDKVVESKNNKPKGSVFTDKDFANIRSR